MSKLMPVADPDKVRVHYMVQTEDGPIASQGLRLNAPDGVRQLGGPSRWQVACNRDLIFTAANAGHDAGTGELVAVTCDDCKATDIFQQHQQARDNPPPPLVEQVYKDPDGCQGCQ